VPRPQRSDQRSRPPAVGLRFSARSLAVLKGKVSHGLGDAICPSAFK